MTVRKPRPEPLDRATVEAMIAEAVAAERARSDQALAGVMLALGGAAQSMDQIGEAMAEVAQTLDLHEELIRPMANAFAAGLDDVDAADSPTPN